jgi:uncharacterized protein (TIGR00369 family)
VPCIVSMGTLRQVTGTDNRGQRRGVFWAGVEGRLPVPNAARTLGFELVDADPVGGTITVEFVGSPAFTNPYGEVLGGFLAAMLYDTVGPALLATLDEGEFIETDELQVTFSKPAVPGPIIGTGEVVRRDGDSVWLAARLRDQTEEEVASATAFARVVPLRQPS